jgi:hypothetical protein
MIKAIAIATFNSGPAMEELLVGLFRDTLEARYSADRQQGHVGRRHSERARREDVTEFVRHHAGEQKHQEGKPLPGRLRSARDPAGGENPAQKQQECDVDADRRSGDPADIERPRHGGLQAGSGWPLRNATNRLLSDR